MSVPASQEAEPRAGRREWTGLAVLALPTLLLALDQSVLFLALPKLGPDLGPSSTQVLWIADIYGFMIAGFLLTMGTLGDRIGRRKLLMIGAAAVGVASALAAYSVTSEMLIATRALLGVAAATLMPSTLALISNMFRNAAQRGTAIAVWMSCFMAGTALGPLIGGILLEYFWWGSVFLMGVPVMVLLLVTAPVLLPEYRDTNAGRIDLLSVVLSLAAILPVIYGLKEIARNGPGVTYVVAIVVGLAVGVVFVRRQRTLDSPLVDVRLFANRAFTASLLLLMIAMSTMGGIYLLITGFLQSVEGLSPLEAGLWMIPSAVASIVAGLSAPMLAQRIAPALVVTSGLVVSGVGYVLLTQVESVGGLPLLITGFVLAFFGTGPIGALGTNLVVSSAPPGKAGSAASMSETSGEFGVSFGVAALGSVGLAVYRGQIEGTVPADLPADAASRARESVDGANAVAGQLPTGQAGQLLAPAREAFTSGLNLVAVVCVVLVVVLAVMAVTMLRGLAPGSHGGEDDGGDGGAEQAGDAPTATADGDADGDAERVPAHAPGQAEYARRDA